MLKAILQLPRTVWLLGLVSLFNDPTSELVYHAAARLDPVRLDVAGHQPARGVWFFCCLRFAGGIVA